VPDRDALIESGRGLAFHLAGRYGGRDGDPYREDLRSAAMVALVLAAAAYDPDRGVRFSTYAWTAIRRALARELGRLASPATVPAGLRPELRPYAVDPVHDDEGNEVPLVELLEDGAPGPDDLVETADVAREVRLAVAELRRRRDRDVVRARYLGDEVLTMDKAGAALQISRQRVCQIEARAFRGLRARLAR